MSRAAILATCVALVPAPTLPAQVGGGHWRPEDRVLVADFGYVTALARSSSQLFAASSGGLLVFDDLRRRWEPPLTREDGWPDLQVTAMAFDRRDRMLWIALIDGRLLGLDPHGFRWTDEWRIGRVVERIVPDASGVGGLLLGTGQGWLRLDPFTGALQQASGAEANEAIERDPYLRARRELVTSPGFESVRAFVGTGPDGTLWPITDVMPADEPSRFWIATAGAGLSLLETFAMNWQPVAVGLLGSGASAVVLADGDAWIAPLAPMPGRYGLTRVSSDFESWEVIAASAVPGVPHRGVRAMAMHEGQLWVAGETGVQRRAANGGWAQVAAGAWNATHGLRALALGDPVIESTSTLWVGGDRGLDRLRPGAAGPERVISGTTVAGILAASGGAWVATDRGLLFADTTGRASPAEGVPAFPARAVAGDGSTVWAGVDRDVWVREPRAGWRRMDELGALSAPVSALAVGHGVLWVGTADELVSLELEGGPLRRYTFASGDLPFGPFGERGITAIAPVSRGRVWVAIPAGALRIDDPF